MSARPDVLDDTKLGNLADDLNALSNVQRVRLIHLLTHPRYAEEIAEALGMSRQSALKHIEKLEERGFIRAMHGRRATGPVIEYVVVPQRLFALGVGLQDLAHLEPEGGPQVRLAENTIVTDEQGVPLAPSQPSLLGQPHLLLVNGPGSGTRFPLDGTGPRWTLGRDDDRHVQLKHDPFISGRHAEIQVDSQGHSIVDVFSANGTLVNHGRIPRGGRVPLRVGDVISLGHTYLVYRKE